MPRLTPKKTKKSATKTAPQPLRSALLRASKGYEPCSLLEVHLRAGIGAILCKKQWWTKWRRGTKRKATAKATEPTIREKWLAELTDSIIERTLYYHTLAWNQPKVWFSTGAASTGYISRDEKALRLWKQAANEPIDKGAFMQHNKLFENFSMVAWYCYLYLENREPPGSYREVSIDSPATLSMAREMINKACVYELTKANFHEHYEGADVRPHVLDALWFHICCARMRLRNVRACAEQTLETLISQYYLDDTSCTEPFISPGPASETWIADGLIPAAIKDRFVAQVAALEAVPEEEKDWHLGSNQQVLDLVHPSLYCCVFGETPRVPSSLDMSDCATVVDRMTKALFNATETVEKPSGVDRHQWIPSEFRVDNDGAVEILSYINNLHPETHSDMYTSIASIFQEMVPMFDRVLTCLANPPPRPVLCTRTLWRRNKERVPWLPNVPKELDLEPELPTSYTIKGRTVQVITKIAEIHLTPENPEYSGGVWHIEGTEVEGIVATGIYYFGCDNITESRLSFEVFTMPPNIPEEDDVGAAAVFGFEEGMATRQYRGCATAIEDRCIVFPNTLQHKVEPFKLNDPTRPGVRKILAFFLVDPDRSIPSTAVIPPQQEDWRRRAQQQLLPPLPDAKMNQALLPVLPSRTMTLEDAKREREELMKDRTSGGHSGWSYEFVLSFCEH